jgi:hypothetical protein
VTSIPLFIFYTFVLITTLSGCVAPEQTELNASVNDDLDFLAPVIMQKPERLMLNGISDPYTLSLQRMLGLVAEDIHKMFGIPDFKHYDSPAEIWQYREDSCLLDIFLYVDKYQSNILRVRHAEARSRNITKISEQKCFLQALRTNH